MAGMSTTRSTASVPLRTGFDASARAMLLGIGGWLGILGGVLALAANALHPHSSEFQLEGLLQAIAQNPAWAPVHLTLIFGLLLILAAMVAITLTIEDEPGASVARFACVAALLGGALILVSSAMDGFAMNRIAQAWFTAPAVEKAAVLRVAEGFENAQYAIYSLSVVIFLGMGIALYGFATVLGSTYPKVLGWLAIVAGAGTFVVGILQTLGGPGLRSTEVFFVLFSMLSTGWIITMGLLMVRLARSIRA